MGGRKVPGGQDMCRHTADSYWVQQKLRQHCKAIILPLKKKRICNQIINIFNYILIILFDYKFFLFKGNKAYFGPAKITKDDSPYTIKRNSLLFKQ